MTETNRPSQRPVVLCILDGWGWREDTDFNAVAQARTPSFDGIWSTSPRCFLKTSGADVGLPDGQMGNSEVGHMNIGAGRIVLQDLPRIDAAVADGSIRDLAALRRFIEALRASGGTAHVMGLLSPGGVHSHQRHMAAIVKAIAEEGVPVAIHGFLDGRDVPPQSAIDTVPDFMAQIDGVAGARVATISGRYYAMDRDKRWERTGLAYECLVDAKGPQFPDWRTAVEASYADGVTDEFMIPGVIEGYGGMADGDGILMINFRADRARQLLLALSDPNFDDFPHRKVAFAARAGMVEYSTALSDFLDVLFPPEIIDEGMGEIVAQAGRTQLRIAETEKYPHVTFFFNGGREEVYEGEDRALIPSPKVATYDLMPEMSAREVTDQVVEAVRSLKYDLIVINYANPDMVGHSGILEAAIKAVEAVDEGLGRLIGAVREVNGVAFVTADHGNAEMMQDPSTHKPHTAHTKFVVPAVLVNAESSGTTVSLDDGRLADIAPTLLTLMGLPQPGAMTGRSLIRMAGN